MKTVESIIKTIRFAADQSDFASCEGQIMLFFDEIDKHKALSIVLEQLKQYQPIFAQSYSDVIWMPDVLNLIEAQESSQQIESLLRWEEFKEWDHNAYFSSVETLSWAYSELCDENHSKAREYLLRSLQAIMNAHRYHFWSTHYPHLEQFWNLEDGNLDGMLASLSFARDPIVQAFMKDEWYGIAAQIGAWDQI